MPLFRGSVKVGAVRPGASTNGGQEKHTVSSEDTLIKGNKTTGSNSLLHNKIRLKRKRCNCFMSNVLQYKDINLPCIKLAWRMNKQTLCTKPAIWEQSVHKYVDGTMSAWNTKCILYIPYSEKFSRENFCKLCK